MKASKKWAAVLLVSLCMQSAAFADDSGGGPAQPSGPRKPQATSIDQASMDSVQSSWWDDLVQWVSTVFN